MKTNVFNLKRVGLLFQRYLIERFRTELIYWGIMAIVFMMIRNNVQTMTALIVVAGVFYAARFFKEVHHPTSGIAYFMIPATQLEKLTVAIIMTSFYYYAMMIVVYVIGNLSGTFFGNMLAGMDFLPNGLFQHSPLQWSLFEEVSSNLPIDIYGQKSLMIISFFITFLLTQSLFLLGGLYFRKNQAFKTFSSLILIGLLLAILALAEVKLILGDEILRAGTNWNINPSPVMAEIFRIALLMFFWVVSYFRLTEKQV